MGDNARRHIVRRNCSGGPTILRCISDNTVRIWRDNRHIGCQSRPAILAMVLGWILVGAIWPFPYASGGGSPPSAAGVHMPDLRTIGPHARLKVPGMREAIGRPRERSGDQVGPGGGRRCLPRASRVQRCAPPAASSAEELRRLVDSKLPTSGLGRHLPIKNYQSPLIESEFQESAWTANCLRRDRCLF